MRWTKSMVFGLLLVPSDHLPEFRMLENSTSPVQESSVEVFHGVNSFRPSVGPCVGREGTRQSLAVGSRQCRRRSDRGGARSLPIRPD
jgi:hypothetical protein